MQAATSPQMNDSASSPISPQLRAANVRAIRNSNPGTLVAARRIPSKLSLTAVSKRGRRTESQVGLLHREIENRLIAFVAKIGVQQMDVVLHRDAREAALDLDRFHDSREFVGGRACQVCAVVVARFAGQLAFAEPDVVEQHLLRIPDIHQFIRRHLQFVGGMVTVEPQFAGAHADGVPRQRVSAARNSNHFITGATIIATSQSPEPKAPCPKRLRFPRPRSRRK